MRSLIILSLIFVMAQSGRAQTGLTIQADILSGQVPLTVNFSANADDQDGAIRLHRWQFGDGSESRAANPVHTYISGGEFTVTYTAYDSDGKAASASLVISVTDPLAPQIRLTAPFTDDSYATDEPVILLAGEVSSGSVVKSLVWDNIRTGDAAIVDVKS